MSNLDLYKVDLDTPQPNGRRGESPRSAFTKHNDLIDALLGGMVDVISSTAPGPAPYVTWVDTSANPPLIRRRNATNTQWVTIGPALGEFGDLAYQDEADLGLKSAAFAGISDIASQARLVVMTTPKGQPTYMYRIPAFNCEDVAPGGELGTGLHPAFLFNGTPAREIFVSAYLASEVNGEMVSQPGRDPRVSINFDQARARCQDLGAGWDMMSNWDWAAVSFLCMADGFQPRGNTNYGRSHERRWETGTRIVDAAPGVSEGVGATGRTLTGSGPTEWSHNNAPIGIHDLVGNVWEWSHGIKLIDNIFHLAPDNGMYSDAQYHNTGFAAPAEGTFSTRPNTGAPLIAKRALAVPAGGSLAPNGYFYKNASGERVAVRGGNWSYGGNSGLGALSLRNDRSNANSAVGFRLRFRNL